MLASRTVPAFLLVFGLAALTFAQDSKSGEKKDPQATEKKDPPKADDTKKDPPKADDKKKEPHKTDDKKDPPKADDKKRIHPRHPPGAAKFETKFELNKPLFMKMTTNVKQSIKVQGSGDSNQSHTQTFYFKWTSREARGRQVDRQTDDRGRRSGPEHRRQPGHI